MPAPGTTLPALQRVLRASHPSYAALGRQVRPHFTEQTGGGTHANSMTDAALGKQVAALLAPAVDPQRDTQRDTQRGTQRGGGRRSRDRPPSNVYATTASPYTAPAQRRMWYLRRTKPPEVYNDDDLWRSDIPELRDDPYEPRASRAPSPVQTTSRPTSRPTPRPTLSAAPVTRFLV